MPLAITKVGGKLPVTNHDKTKNPNRRPNVNQTWTEADKTALWFKRNWRLDWNTRLTAHSKRKRKARRSMYHHPNPKPGQRLVEKLNLKTGFLLWNDPGDRGERNQRGGLDRVIRGNWEEGLLANRGVNIAAHTYSPEGGRGQREGGKEGLKRHKLN